MSEAFTPEEIEAEKAKAVLDPLEIPKESTAQDALSPEGLTRLKGLQLDVQLVAVPVDHIRQLLDVIHLLAAEVENFKFPKAAPHDCSGPGCSECDEEEATS